MRLKFMGSTPVEGFEVYQRKPVESTTLRPPT
jgi:hypothetical protein